MASQGSDSSGQDTHEDHWSFQSRAYGRGGAVLMEATFQLPTPKPGQDSATQAIQLLELYQQEREPELLNHGITLAKQADELLRPDDAWYQANVTNLFNFLAIRFNETKHTGDLDEMVRIGNKAATACPHGTEAHRKALLGIAWGTTEKFKLSGLWRDLENGIRLMEVLLPSLHPSVALHAELKEYTAQMYEMKFEQTGNIADLKRAVQYSEEGVLCCSLTTPKLDSFLSGHLQRSATYAKKIKAVSDIEKLISTMAPFATWIQENSQSDYRSQCLNSYCDLVSHVYYITGRPSDLLNALNVAVLFVRVITASVLVEDFQFTLGKVTRLLDASQEDPIVTQVSSKIHANFCAEVRKDEEGGYLFGLSSHCLLDDIVVRIQSSDPVTLEMLPEETILARWQFAQSLGAVAVSLGTLINTSQEQLAQPDRFNGMVSQVQTKMARIEEALSESGLYEPGETPTLRDQHQNFSEKLKDFLTRHDKLRPDFDLLKREKLSLTEKFLSEGQSLKANISCFMDLDKVLSQIYEETDELGDLDSVIAHLKSGLVFSEDSHKQCTLEKNLKDAEDVGNLRRWIKLQLSKKLSSRYLHTLSKDDIIESEALTSQLLNEKRNILARASPRSSQGRSHGRDNKKKIFEESEESYRAKEQDFETQFYHAKSLRLKYKFHNGTVDDLDVAVSLLEDVLRKVRRAIRFSKGNLLQVTCEWGLLMRARYRELGELGDLEAGIEVMVPALEDAIDAARISDKIKQQRKLDMTLNEKYIRPLTEILIGHEDNIDTTVSTVVLAGSFNNLSLLLQDKFERTKSLESLQLSIKYSRAAIKFDGSSSMTNVNLANALLESYFLTSEERDLAEAVALAEHAVNNGDVNHPERAISMIDASSVYLAAWNHWSITGYLNEAYRCAKYAVDFPPASQTTYPYILLEFAKTAEARYAHKPDSSKLEEVTRAYITAWQHNGRGASPKIRATAVRSAVRLLMDQERDDELGNILEAAVQYMPTACPRWMVTVDRSYIVSLFSGIPADTAAISIKNWTGKKSLSPVLQRLELGRGVIIGSTVEYRSAKQRLQAHSPELYQKYNRLCLRMDALANDSPSNSQISRFSELVQQLETLTNSIRELPTFQQFSPPIHAGSGAANRLANASPTLYRNFMRVQRMFEATAETESGKRNFHRRETSQKMDEALASLRNESGMEDFLLPPNEQSMLALAKEGPIVVVTSSKLLERSDAIIIQERGITAVSLPGLSPSSLQEWTTELSVATRDWTPRNFASKNIKMREYLLWLWETTVLPILTALDIHPQKPSTTKQRLHWVGVGHLSRAPFHAAGDHSLGSIKNTMSHVVSSYAPTLRSLAYAREQGLPNAILSQAPRMLLVGAPGTPGMANLDGVSEEIDVVKSACESSMSVVRLQNPTLDQVIDELPLSSIVHFACHGVSDPLDPDNSHLVLQDNELSSSERNSVTGDAWKSTREAISALETGQQRMKQQQHLTVRHISACRSPAAELAYLSACSAAENRVIGLADEAVHIATAFHLAGFRHVVATMWLARDDACPQIASKFYANLLQQSGSRNENQGATQPQQPSSSGGANKEPFQAAWALHDAVDELRTQYWNKPLLWAPFVHIGA